MRLDGRTSGGSLFEQNLTALIDVMFQLVLFFVFSLKFLAFEGELNAGLPTDRGGGSAPPNIAATLERVSFRLDWDPGEGGSVRLSAVDDRGLDGGAAAGIHLFPCDPATRLVFGPRGEVRVVTETDLSSPGRRKGAKIVYDYRAPDFRAVEAYLERRQDEQAARMTRRRLRVSVSFDDRVPWQMVVNLADIFKRLGIPDFEVAAGEAGR